MLLPIFTYENNFQCTKKMKIVFITFVKCKHLKPVALSKLIYQWVFIYIKSYIKFISDNDIMCDNLEK